MTAIKPHEYYDKVVKPAMRRSRPLREIFPTMGGHRTATCPFCGARCGWHDRDEGYFCPNMTKGSGHPIEGRPVVFR